MFKSVDFSGIESSFFYFLFFLSPSQPGFAFLDGMRNTRVFFLSDRTCQKSVLWNSINHLCFFQLTFSAGFNFAGELDRKGKMASENRPLLER